MTMRIAYVSDLQLDNSISLEIIKDLSMQIINRFNDTLDYIILNGGIVHNYVKLLDIVDTLQEMFKEHSIHTVVRFNVGNIDYYYKDVVIDKVGKFYEIDKIFKNHRLYLPRNPIITGSVWVMGCDTWYDYSLYRGEPTTLQKVTLKDNRNVFTRLFTTSRNKDNVYITDSSDYCYGVNSTFDVKHTEECVESFRSMCDRYDKTISQPLHKIVCGYFYSNHLYLSSHINRDGYYDAFSGSMKFDDIFKSRGITEYICGKSSSYRTQVLKDGVRYRNSATTFNKNTIFSDKLVLGDVLVVEY